MGVAHVGGAYKSGPPVRMQTHLHVQIRIDPVPCIMQLARQSVKTTDAQSAHAINWNQSRTL